MGGLSGPTASAASLPLELDFALHLWAALVNRVLLNRRNVRGAWLAVLSHGKRVRSGRALVCQGLGLDL